MYIPLAWSNDDFDSCLDWFNGWIKNYGEFDVDMVRDWREDIDFGKYDVVYIGGGNTFKLLQRLRKGGLDKKLVDYYNIGGLIFGGSAGAIIWGNNIDIALICEDADENKVGLQDTSGFDFVSGYDIQCHYADDQEKEHLAHIRKTGRNVVGIPEESAVVVSDDGFKVIGEKGVSVIRKDSIKKYNPGEMLEL